MPLTGRYDLKGTQKVVGALAYYGALMASPTLSFLTKGCLGKLTYAGLKQVANWAANKGLAFGNVIVDNVDVALDEKTYNERLEKALAMVREYELKKQTLTEEQLDKMDEEVKDAARKFIRFTKPAKS